MSEVYATTYVRLDGRAIMLAELLADPGLMARAQLADNPLGGVEFGSPADYYRIDDALGFVVDEILVEGPALLRAGKSLSYQLRLSHGTDKIQVSGGLATANDGGSSFVEVPAEDLAAAFETALADYRAALAG